MIIGVTGSFGSGKTTVSGMFGKLGAGVIDADKTYHLMIKPGEVLYRKIIKNFGGAVLKKDRTIDRKKLSKIVFEDKAKLALLNKLAGGEIIKEMRSRLRSRRGGALIVDAPLLIESGFYREMDKVVVVRADKKKQIGRLRARGAMSREEALKRIRTQMPLKEKSSFADFVIDNSGSREKTSRQVKEIWKTIRGESWR